MNTAEQNMEANNMNNTEQTIEANAVRTCHEVIDTAKYNQLVQAMGAEGWVGRPLLVIREGEGRLRALTGSHRLAAAQEVGVEVPALVVDVTEDNADELEIEGGVVWADSDDRKAYVLRQLGLTAAADLMDAEVAANKEG